MGLSILNHHLILQESGAKEFIELTEEAKESRSVCVSDLEKGILIMATGSAFINVALLLTYEQFFKNLFNPNKSTDGSQKKSKPTAFSRNIVKGIFYNGLRSTICREISVTLLQLLSLLCEHKDILGRDELQVIAVAVTQKVLDNPKAPDNLRKGRGWFELS